MIIYDKNKLKTKGIMQSTMPSFEPKVNNFFGSNVQNFEKK
jgi:hypothetical protein